MKKIFAFIFVSIILSSLAVPAFAEEPEEGNDENGNAVDDSNNDISNDSDSLFTSSILTVADLEQSEDYTLTDISLYSVSPIESEDTSGLKQVLIGLIGSYDAIVVEYQYMNSNSSYYSYLREIQPDYVWIASFLLFALIIYCLFRLGGALLGKC